MNLGIYEQLITAVLRAKLDSLDRQSFYINTAPIDKDEASRILVQHLGSAIITLSSFYYILSLALINAKTITF